MTWGVLLITVEGLYLCLPAVGREFGAQFEVWDWRDQSQWGFGAIRQAAPMPGESVETARTRRRAEETLLKV